MLFGVRHLPAGAGRYLDATLARARLYDRALSAEEVSASSSGLNLFVSEKQLLSVLNDEQKSQRNDLLKTISESEKALAKVPKNNDINKARPEIQRRYDDEIKRSSTHKLLKGFQMMILVMVELSPMQQCLA